MVLTRFKPSLSEGMDKFLALGMHTIISIVLFMFKVKLLFLDQLDMLSNFFKMVDGLTDGIIR